MIKPILVPLESLEAEEDNEPPSFEKLLDRVACPSVRMISPAFGLTSSPNPVHQNPYDPGSDLSKGMLQQRCCRIPLRGPGGGVLAFFPWHRISGSPWC
jgi:hypothetical protein